MLMVCLASGYVVTLSIALSYLIDPDFYFLFYGQRDPAGAQRLSIYIHIIPGLIALLFGPWQFSSRFRAASPGIHRLTGWLYVFSVATSVVAALRLSVHAYGGLANGAGFALAALAWAVTTSWGLTMAIKRNVVQHRRWMIRSYTVTLAAASLRFQLGFLTGVTGLEFDRAYAFVAWTCWIPLMLLTEIWLRIPRPEPVAR